ncbi:MAG: S49 family peptidase [Hyphomicrobiaceae bacterium]
MATPLRPGLSLATVAGVIERAFSMSKLPSVAIAINSPGGSPAQSHLIYKRVRQLAGERKKRVYVFCEDVAASGGYFLALAGDEIYADPSSIVGSIGVISASFGLDKAIDKLGIERRIYTSGRSKSFLDPFRPENADDVARLKDVQRDVHDAFIAIVRERRAGKLPQDDAHLFTGAFWAAGKARDLGLIDGIDDMRSKMRALHGENVRLRIVSPSSGGLLGRLLRPRLSYRPPSTWRAGALDAGHFADGLLSAVERRSLWSRYGF